MAPFSNTYQPFPCWALNILVQLDQYCVCQNRELSDARRTKSQNLNDSRLVLQLSLSNPLKPGVKSRMKM